MTLQLYIHCVIACLIGNLLHIGFKIISLQKDHKIANLEFSVGKYLTRINGRCLWMYLHPSQLCT